MGEIAVVGSVVIDEIHTRGRIIRSFGGITYSVLTLAALLPDFTVIPVTYIGSAEIDEYLGLISKFPNVNTRYIKAFQGGSNRNKLIYREDEERDEYFELVTPPITFRDLMPFLEIDAFLVNYIKNDDLSFEDLKTLSYAFKGVLYMDIHSLLRKRDKDGGFRLHKLKNWQSWARMADILQMNRVEIQYFTGFEAESVDDLKSLALFVVSQGPKALNLTLGSEGSILAYRKEGIGYIKKFSAPKARVVDPTGCGDVFGASYLAHYLKKGDYEEAAKFANRIASESVSYPGLDYVFVLKERSTSSGLLN